MKKYWIIILPILFALAVLLGLLQRQYNPFASRTSITNFAQNGSLEDYYDKGQGLATEKDRTSTVSFLAVGDIMLSRNVALETQKQNDTNYPFLGMREVFNSVDFTFGNLETPFSERPIVGGHSLIFASPTSSIEALLQNKFRVLNLANNHALDQGKKGLDFTIGELDRSGIKHTGVGTNLEQAWQPAIIEQNGIKICFVGASYASINDNGKTTNTYVARIEDTENLKLQIKNSKSLCDFVIATMHAGTEYVQRPNRGQIDFARAAIDYGADVVIGAHPHWVQTIEKYQGKYIFYSLGNFIFDQMWSQETREGLTLKINLSKPPESQLQGSKTAAKLESIELIPVIIENYSQPRPATEEESRNILKNISETKILY